MNLDSCDRRNVTRRTSGLTRGIVSARVRVLTSFRKRHAAHTRASAARRNRWTTSHRPRAISLPTRSIVSVRRLFGGELVPSVRGFGGGVALLGGDDLCASRSGGVVGVGVATVELRSRDAAVDSLD